MDRITDRVSIKILLPKTLLATIKEKIYNTMITITLNFNVIEFLSIPLTPVFLGVVK